MRKEKKLKLSPEITVTVLELRPRDLKHALGLMQQGGDIDFQKLLMENWDDALAKLSGVIRADKGGLEDLSFSEIDEVRAAFMEVNASFFGLLGKMGINLGLAGMALGDPSIAPASPLSSEDTSTSSITDGDSS